MASIIADQGAQLGGPARQQLSVRATAPDGSAKEFSVLACIDTAVELAYYRHGGILPYVLRKLA